MKRYLVFEFQSGSVSIKIDELKADILSALSKYSKQSKEVCLTIHIEGRSFIKTKII